MAESEKLLVSIAADTRNLRSELLTADTAIGRFARNAEAASAKVAAVLGAGLGAGAVAALTHFAGRALETGAAIGRLADMAGLSTKDFQEMAFALRRSGVEGEQLSVAFATFGRNLSDLQRGTGGFLDFLRRSAPQLVDQFKRATDVSDAFGVLVSTLSQLTDKHDQLRLSQAAGGEQMARLAIEAARLGPAFAEARRQAQETGHVLSQTQVEDLRRAQQAWKDLSDGVVLSTGKTIAAFQRFAKEPGQSLDLIRERLGRLIPGFNSLDVATQETIARFDHFALSAEELWRRLQNLDTTMKNVVGKMGAPMTLQADAIKAASGELALLQQRLQAVPIQAELSSSAFVAAWEKQIAVMRLQGETDDAIAAARIAMLRQEDAERLRVLGSAIQPYDELIRRQHELNKALETGLIDSAAFARATAIAAATMRDSYLSATSAVGQAVARVFDGNKSVAVAAAIIDTFAAANKALASPPGPPVSFAYVAAALATGFANVRSILSTTKTSTAAPGGGAATAPVAPAAMVQQQSLNITGVDPAMFYSGGQLESFIRGLNEATKNGATLLASVPRV